MIMKDLIGRLRSDDLEMAVRVLQFGDEEDYSMHYNLPVPVVENIDKGDVEVESVIVDDKLITIVLRGRYAGDRLY